MGTARMLASPFIATVSWHLRWIPTPLVAIALLCVFFLMPKGAAAQELTAALGYSQIPEGLGPVSNQGVVFRLGIDFVNRRHLTWGVEGGVERLNEGRRQANPNICFLNDGSALRCHIDSRTRNTGLLIGTVLRVHASPGVVSPYLQVGAGYRRNRARELREAVDDFGNAIPDLSSDRTDGSDGLHGHLGGGLLVQPTGSRVGFTVEGRATYLVYDLDGRDNGWDPSITVGVRLRL